MEHLIRFEVGGNAASRQVGGRRECRFAAGRRYEVGCRRSGQKHSVIGQLAARRFFELGQEILDGHVLFLFGVEVQDDLAFVHHDGPVAQGQGVLHVMGDHEGGEVVFLDQVAGEAQDLFSGLGVQGGGVLIQEEELRLLEGGHEQGQGLALSAGQEAYLAGHAGFEAQVQGDIPSSPLPRWWSRTTPR